MLWLLKDDLANCSRPTQMNTLLTSLQMPVGTPEMVADVMEDWVNNGDIDGFNIACRFSLSC
jgi:alkanesulfonate monooxygenase SsuD/methylene tetrahydromethanopterin reductase-like flavin-dependent oxidoreductase (luciferase family)